MFSLGTRFKAAREIGLLTCGCHSTAAFPLRRAVAAMAFYMPLTVAGQWRTFTAFPGIPQRIDVVVKDSVCRGPARV